MSHKNILNECVKRQSNDPCTSTSSTTSSALDRLRYNLSPVTSYYKPLVKSFTQRDESPNKVSTTKQLFWNRNRTKKNLNETSIKI